jgi:N-acetylglucosaminyl-diphospho-decaprenol L-rhamnosyltransferase
LAIRRSAFETVDGFDERMFLYDEEINLAYRLRQAGWETHFVPAAAIMHAGGARTIQRELEMARQLMLSRIQLSRHQYAAWQLLLLRLSMGYVMLRHIWREALHLGVGARPQDQAPSRASTSGQQRCVP